MDAWQRISDVDRERAMADLGTHYAEGRLDHEEYDERLDAVWSSKTSADLATLFHDLPRLVPTSTSPVRTRPTRFRPWMGVAGLLLAALAVITVLKIVPWWILLIAVVVVVHKLRHRHAARGPCAPHRR